tara:strand:+ start:765 stop:956 length:192 start_codon:yes stop_codon:yes gene_type:complete
MKKVNNILKIIGALITAFCLTICVISVIGLLNSTDQKQAMYFIYSISFAGLGLISMLSTLDEI